MGGKVRGVITFKVDGEPYAVSAATDDIDQVAGEPLVGLSGTVHEKVELRASMITVSVIEDEDTDIDILLAKRDGQIDLDYGNGKAVVMTGYHSRGGTKNAEEGIREVVFYGIGRRA
jgi:hypothetical protein